MRFIDLSSLSPLRQKRTSLATIDSFFPRYLSLARYLRSSFTRRVHAHVSLSLSPSLIIGFLRFFFVGNKTRVLVTYKSRVGMTSFTARESTRAMSVRSSPSYAVRFVGTCCADLCPAFIDSWSAREANAFPFCFLSISYENPSSLVLNASDHRKYRLFLITLLDRRMSN